MKSEKRRPVACLFVRPFDWEESVRSSFTRIRPQPVGVGRDAGQTIFSSKVNIDEIAPPAASGLRLVGRGATDARPESCWIVLFVRRFPPFRPFMGRADNKQQLVLFTCQCHHEEKLCLVLLLSIHMCTRPGIGRNGVVFVSDRGAGDCCQQNHARCDFFVWPAFAMFRSQRPLQEPSHGVFFFFPFSFPG